MFNCRCFQNCTNKRVWTKSKSWHINQEPNRYKAISFNFLCLAFFGSLVCVSVISSNIAEYYWSTKRKRPTSWFIPITGRNNTGSWWKEPELYSYQNPLVKSFIFFLPVSGLIRFVTTMRRSLQRTWSYVNWPLIKAKNSWFRSWFRFRFMVSCFSFFRADMEKHQKFTQSKIDIFVLHRLFSVWFLQRKLWAKKLSLYRYGKKFECCSISASGKVLVLASKK